MKIPAPIDPDMHNADYIQILSGWDCGGGYGMQSENTDRLCQ